MRSRFAPLGATGQPGVCVTGTLRCQGGGLVCVRDVNPTLEICNGLDDNCDGHVNEGTGGGSCTTGRPGVCAAGTRRCAPRRHPHSQAHRRQRRG
jgi:hypothetical protein